MCTNRCLVVCLVVSCVVLSSSGILVGRIRQKEEPASNVVPSSAFLFPETDDYESCKTDLGYPGRCVDIRMCHAARRAVSNRNHPIRCGWINNFIPRVCCHPDQVQYSKLVFLPARDRRRNGVLRTPS